MKVKPPAPAVFLTVPLLMKVCPVPATEVVEKFLSLASPPLGDDRARELVKVVDRVETLTDLRELSALLAPRG